MSLKPLKLKGDFAAFLRLRHPGFTGPVKRETRLDSVPGLDHTCLLFFNDLSARLLAEFKPQTLNDVLMILENKHAR